MGKQGPLSRFRVLEIGSGDALAYCGKIFSDFGAEVTKAEPKGGDARRREGVTVPGETGPESAFFGWLNSNKICIEADPSEPSGVATLRDLLPSCDLLLDGRSPSEIENSDLPHTALEAAEPGLSIVAISNFGPTGPYRDFQATDATLRSLSGLVFNTGPVDAEPMLAREGQSAVVGGTVAFLPAAAALLGAADGGRRYATSIHAALCHVIEYDVGLQMEGGRGARRGVNLFGRAHPAAPYPTASGWLGLTIMSEAQWHAFCKIIGHPELGDDIRFNSNPKRIQRHLEIDEIIKPILLEHSAAHWFELGLRDRIPMAIIPDVHEVASMSFHAERGSFGTLDINGKQIVAPVLPLTLTRTPPRRDSIAPTRPVAPASLAPRKRIAPKRIASGPPLRGVRILDLTMGWAGPMAVRHLADLGADVVKVESLARQDWFRGIDSRPPYHAEKTYEKYLTWHFMNRNKRGITVDMTTPDGRELLLKFVKKADIVIDSFAADVMPKFDLAAEKLLEVNPRAVVVTMPAFGMKTSWRYGRAYGATLEHASGLPSVNGLPGGPPTMSHSMMGDPFGGLTAASSMLVALHEVRVSGRGQHVDISQVQGMLPLFAEALLEHAVTGEKVERVGNVHPRFAPYGCYKTLRTDTWLTIAIRTDAEWQSLCAEMKRQDLACDPELANAAGRRANAERIDAAISQWLAPLKATHTMTQLQKAGIAAGVVREPLEILLDPHVMATGQWTIVDHPILGGHLQPNPPYRQEDIVDGGAAIKRPSPTLGQHNHEVLVGEMGMDEATYQKLLDDEQIGFEAIPARRNGNT